MKSTCRTNEPSTNVPNIFHNYIFHPLALGLALGITLENKKVTHILGFALGLRGLSDTNMLVVAMRNARIRAHAQREPRRVRGFAF